MLHGMLSSWLILSFRYNLRTINWFGWFVAFCISFVFVFVIYLVFLFIELLLLVAMFGWFVGRLIGWLVGLFGYFVDRLVGRFIHFSIHYDLMCMFCSLWKTHLWIRGFSKITTKVLCAWFSRKYSHFVPHTCMWRKNIRAKRTYYDRPHILATL